MKKEEYLVQFETQDQANFWMRRMYRKFEPEVIKLDKVNYILEFEEAIYYFWSKNRVSPVMNKVTKMSPDSIYIIVDDPERKRLSTYRPEGTLDLNNVKKAR